jgi:hypothetical protein
MNGEHLVQWELAGNPKYLEKICPIATFFIIKPVWIDLGWNPDRRGGKPKSNPASYGTANAVPCARTSRANNFVFNGVFNMTTFFLLCAEYKIQQFSNDDVRSTSLSGDDVLTLYKIYYMQVTVAPRSKAWTVFARSKAWIVGSNRTQCMDGCIACVHSLCVVLCIGRGLATGWSSVQGVLPTMYRMKKLKKRPRPNKEL